ncbi:putative lipoprotein with Yx(FWY)xxD motif [Arthrobacter stackebrandtii]|uniref:Lipoprotein with Yx(FWY)xxD motif n=1 Tax=Arthrobacter stackebrandtii TaxID=272161 RepID=A0ABS4Z0U8_9MICC|nr:hypothetical protein [Arthrobacter stackebrandtii]MBP2414669.1 putative lipoprotein with Yx(FWY)xxD motif [Arthrobacter stackebrandtii]PYH01762.1 hypothetical protein CVV67_04735 [Arthrobacter stackebrandtii]
MKNSTRLWLAGSALALAALTACGGTPGSGGLYGAPGGSSQSQAAAGTLHTAGTSPGTILVNGAGMTLYYYDHDTKGESASACTGPCISLWPAVTTTAATPTIEGVTGTVGTITGTGGAKQVTLNGLPLYTFAGDKKPGDTTGQGYGGIWWVVGPDGAKVTSTSPMPSSSSYGGSAY